MQAFLALLLCALLFMSGASLYWMLGFDFLAIVNVYVYVGALAFDASLRSKRTASGGQFRRA